MTARFFNPWVPLLAALFLTGAARAASEGPPKCKVKIEGYRHLITWTGSSDRIAIEADEACTTSVALPLELKQVRLTIERDGKLLTRLESGTGTLAFEKGRFLLGDVLGPTQTQYFAQSPFVLVDLKSGEVRAPGGQYLDLGRKRAPRI